MTKPAALTPKSMALLRSEGFGLVEKVERPWNPFSKVRNDLYGMFDVLAVSNNAILGVQITSRAHMSERRAKLHGNPNLALWLANPATSCEIHGWFKQGNRWQVKRETVTNKTDL